MTTLDKKQIDLLKNETLKISTRIYNDENIQTVIGHLVCASLHHIFLRIVESFILEKNIALEDDVVLA